jgi:hypothetical protein
MSKDMTVKLIQFNFSLPPETEETTEDKEEPKNPHAPIPYLSPLSRTFTPYIQKIIIQKKANKKIIMQKRPKKDRRIEISFYLYRVL